MSWNQFQVGQALTRQFRSGSIDRLQQPQWQGHLNASQASQEISDTWTSLTETVALDNTAQDDNPIEKGLLEFGYRNQITPNCSQEVHRHLEFSQEPGRLAVQERRTLHNESYGEVEPQTVVHVDSVVSPDSLSQITINHAPDGQLLVATTQATPEGAVLKRYKFSSEEVNGWFLGGR